MRLIDIEAEVCADCVCRDKCDRQAYCLAKEMQTVDAVPVVRKPVVGYEGYYEVDQFGRVFSVDRVISVDDNGRKYEKPIAGKQMKQSLKKKGYKIVSLTKDGTTKMAYVHRLVAEAFIPNPDNLPMVNHKDEDKTNNFLENLEWCTAKYNANYGTGIERHAKKLRGRESEKRVAVVGCTLDGKYEEWFPSIAEAAKIVNGSTSSISKACKGERKTAYGYKWVYADDFCSYGEVGQAMANKDAMLEALEEIESGMCRIKERRSIWQNSLVYALCQAVRLLLMEKIKEGRK